MNDYSVTTSESLLSLCSANGWTDIFSYEECLRLLYANKNGFSISDIASIIWACSDVNIRSWQNIYRLLCDEHEKYVSSLDKEVIRCLDVESERE